MGSDKLRFAPYGEDVENLPYDDNYLVFKWLEPECDVYFSVARRGNAASCHFSSDKRGLRRIKQAINEFVEFVFYLFDWCNMVIAFITRPGVMRIVEKCGFFHAAHSDESEIFVRPRNG